jgi:hypothetical protein
LGGKNVFYTPRVKIAGISGPDFSEPETSNPNPNPMNFYYPNPKNNVNPSPTRKPENWVEPDLNPKFNVDQAIRYLPKSSIGIDIATVYSEYRLKKLTE